jgi:hypothetical protein
VRGGKGKILNKMSRQLILALKSLGNYLIQNGIFLEDKNRAINNFGAKITFRPTIKTSI